jgi:hypothetical protein
MRRSADISAGWKKTAQVPLITAAPSSIQKVSSPEIRVAMTARSMPARTRSQVSMVRRRFHLSTKAPAGSLNTMCVTMLAEPISPACTADPVRSRAMRG